MSFEQPKVSILVPIYNVERYLAQCLDSLCDQTLQEIEIVAINDGSTDGSLAILREYASRDNRIMVIDKPNSGYGASMNRGLAQARGEYIGIVEPDDFAERSMFKKMYKKAASANCDLAKCNFSEHRGNRDYRVPNLKGYPYGMCFDPAEQPRIICTIPSIWTGLYRKEMLDREGIRFRETPGASFQDTSFVMKAWFAAKSCVLLRRCLLYYRIDNPGSSVKTTDKVFTVCDELAHCEGFLRERPGRAEAFLPWFHVDKWGKYRWNYERIGAEAHKPFAERMREEYEAARQRGELDLSLFSPEDAVRVTELLDEGAESFAKRHSETF